jgi:hypothetical protein
LIMGVSGQRAFMMLLLKIRALVEVERTNKGLFAVDASRWSFGLRRVLRRDRISRQLERRGRG